MRVSPTLLWLLLAAGAAAAPPPASSATDKAATNKALELKTLGLAELENEHPERAEAAYRELTAILPRDPLGHANLAIALLRQQKYPEAVAAIDKALQLAPNSGELLAIKGEVLQWTGELDTALATLEKAVAAAPQDVEILYALYQLATTLKNERSDAAAGRALETLARLRPENAIVLLQLGQRAIAAGDRTTASAAFKRIGELLWQEQPLATRALGMVEEALEGNDLGAARVPAVRLENVLKVSPLFRESLRELKTGVQGIPVARLRDEPVPESFGEPLAVSFTGQRLDGRATAGRGLAVGDFDGDERTDVARLRGDGKLEIRLAARGFDTVTELPAAGPGAPGPGAPGLGAPELDELLAADLDNDGQLDLAAFGRERGAVWLGRGGGRFEPAPAELGLAAAGARAAAVIDFDIEGDLDLAVVGGRAAAVDLYRNNLEGPLAAVGTKALPRLALGEARAIVASDLDRDGDLDLLVAHAKGLSWLDNLRQGRFRDRTSEGALKPGPALAATVAIDVDQDGRPDLFGAGATLAAWHNLGGKFSPWPLAGLDGGTDLSSVIAFDADNDGRADLATAGGGGVTVLGQKLGTAFGRLAVRGGPAKATALAAADLDGDGDLDLLAAGPEGLHRLDNQGGNRNHWLAVRLRGLVKGNSKNNVFGVGSVVELRTGRAYQFREAAGDVVHLGLGREAKAEVLRVVWTNGVPQNRLGVERDQRIVEEQLLKGSCPFLYAWNGESFGFVTDLLWGAPLGLPVAPGVWAPSDPAELVKIEGLAPRDGRYELRITEELWEAAFFDHVRLWVVDHPDDVEVASNLRIVPGEVLPEKVLASRELRAVAAAWDGRGTDVTARVARRDEVYADGYEPSPYQGVSEAWTFTFDLGAAPTAAVRLHLDGWIFPADASLNLAVAQRDDLPYLPPRLEVETAAGWQTLMPNMGFPAGKTKTMVVDTPPLPPEASKLRIITSQWLHWDRIAWTSHPADTAPVVRAELLPTSAELRFRGFSQLARKAPNAPHAYDYARLATDSPWLPLRGRYTRYGDVRELLETADDRTVILAPGDEMALVFDAAALPPPAPGMRRTLFLESHGWDKDADRNTGEGEQLEPLPFRAMSGYPLGAGESYPDTPQTREYRERWLTREIGR